MKTQLTGWNEQLLLLEGQLDQVAGAQEVTLGTQTARELLDELKSKVLQKNVTLLLTRTVPF
jgi:hypothetical protein